MRHASAIGLGFVVVAWGCAVPAESETSPAPGASAPASPAGRPPPDLVAWTAGGELAVVDGLTGAVRRRLATTGGVERDVAFDPWQERVLAFEGDDDGGGEIVAHPLVPGRDGPRPGGRAHLAWVDGRARLLPSPFGVVVFEEGYGERWQLLGASPGPSVIAPPPASAWLSIDPSGVRVNALARGPGLERLAARVDPTGLAPPSAATILAASASGPSTARLVPGPAPGVAVLVDVVGASLSVRLVASDSTGPGALVPLAARGMRIEAAVPLEGGEMVALLMSGPAEVMVIAVDPGGAVSAAAHAPLPGQVTAAPTFFSRDLAAHGSGGVLAATSAGVFSLRVLRGSGGVQLGIERGFDGSALRGPVTALGPHP